MPKRVPGAVRSSLADIGAARDAFGYEPLVGLEEGLRRTVAWMREPVPGWTVPRSSGGAPLCYTRSTHPR